jgi:hypothetical protein
MHTRVIFQAKTHIIRKYTNIILLIIRKKWNMKQGKQDYGARSYFKLLLMGLKVIVGITFMYIYLES